MIEAVPSLDDLAANPERARDLPPNVAADLLVKLAGVQSLLLARALAPSRNGHEPPPEDKLFTVAEAAERLGVSEDWLYRRARKLPFAVRVSPRHVRFSARGIERYIRQREGRNPPLTA
jgi:excisionase family DNA binding protein